MRYIENLILDLKWALRIIGAILCIIHSPVSLIIIGALLIVISFFIFDDFYVEIAASNGVPIRCKFEAKNKNDDVNDRFVSIVRKLICEI